MAFLRITLTALACAAALASFEAQARWHTVQGTAPITGSVSEARDEAVNDAIRNAMLEAGAQVSVEQYYRDGVLASNRMQVKSSVPVRKVTVTEEEKTRGRVTVTVRVLLDDEHMHTCAASKLRKAVVPVSFAFADQQAQQGSTGGLEDIAAELGYSVWQHLSASPSLLVRPEVHAALRNAGYGNSPDSGLRQNVRGLAANNQAQFVATGMIRSAAASDAGEGVLDKLFYQRTRNLDFSVSVYDARTGDQIYEKDYNMTADWPFKQGEYLDLRSERFKGSGFGARLADLEKRAAQDLIQELQCRMPAASIIDITDDGFIINIGQENGIAEGMKFTIGQTSQTLSPEGDEYNQINKARGVYIVKKVYPNSALLRAADLNDNLLNIRVGDEVSMVNE